MMWGSEGNEVRRKNEAPKNIKNIAGGQHVSFQSPRPDTIGRDVKEKKLEGQNEFQLAWVHNHFHIHVYEHRAG